MAFSRVQYLIKIGRFPYAYILRPYGILCVKALRDDQYKVHDDTKDSIRKNRRNFKSQDLRYCDLL